jgi:hypothetical protein
MTVVARMERGNMAVSDDSVVPDRVVLPDADQSVEDR